MHPAEVYGLAGQGRAEETNEEKRDTIEIADDADRGKLSAV
jgi:hypothetical protein